MFRARTLFVLGAGASYEADLPVGEQLLEQIVNLTDVQFEHWRQSHGDFVIVEALKIILDEGGSVTKINAHIDAVRRLGQSAQQGLSIDNIIDALEDDKIELVGKLGIVRAILRAEGASAKFRRPDDYEARLNLNQFKKTWYSSLTKLLTENRRVSDFDKVFENVEFIVFNYDRCLEHYLQFSLASYFHVSVERVQAAVNQLVIHRPYGVAGRLPWQEGDRPSIAFGKGSAKDLAAVVQQIRTFTEQIDDEEALSAMRASVSEADRIVFLGFGFHRQNVQLIASDVQDHTEILGTALGVSKADQGVIEEELRAAFGLEWGSENAFRVTLAELTCSDFMVEYWRTMTAAAPDS